MPQSRSQPQPPARPELSALLGARLALYDQLLERTAHLRPEWKYYGAKGGWALKLFRGSRNLCFVMPRSDALRVAFLLGRSHTARALAADLPEAVKEAIRNAREYVEGRPVTVELDDVAALDVVDTLLRLKQQKAS